MNNVKTSSELELDALRTSLDAKLQDYNAIAAELEVMPDDGDKWDLIAQKGQLFSDIAMLSRSIDRLCTYRLFE